MLDDEAFFEDLFTLLLVVAPVAIYFTLWRIFVTNKVGPRGGIMVLGLDDTASVYSEPRRPIGSVYVPLIYCLASLITFLIGVATQSAVDFLRGELSGI